MGQITTDQSHSIVGILTANTNWYEIDFDQSQLQDRIVRNQVEAGKQFTDFIKNGGQALPLWIPIGDGKTKILVNLEAIPYFPNHGTRFQVDVHFGEGWVIVEKREDGLYVDGRKVFLYQSNLQRLVDHQKWPRGCELRYEDLITKSILNANLLVALYENLHLIPEDWKQDSKGDYRVICFWGTIYYQKRPGHEKEFCVRDLIFRENKWWSKENSDLERQFSSIYWAPILEE